MNKIKNKGKIVKKIMKDLSELHGAIAKMQLHRIPIQYL